jgi:hypothetical protein
VKEKIIYNLGNESPSAAHNSSTQSLVPIRFSSDLVTRYAALFPFRIALWHEQRRYVVGERNPWPAVKSPLSERDIERHLDGAERYWIACRCPVIDGTPVTSFLLLDFDTRDEYGVGGAWSRLMAVLGVFGAEFVPFVCNSPGGGLHAIWFFDQPVVISDLVDVSHPYGRPGLLRDVLKSALPSVGPGVCEIFPAANQVVRWPFGVDQCRVDFRTRAVIQGETIGDLIAAAESHRREVPPLTLDHIRRVHQCRCTSQHVLEVIPKPCSSQASLPEPSQATELAAARIQQAVNWYRYGLCGPNTRDSAMFAIAQAMVAAPDSLVPVGFDPAEDVPLQLYQWLHLKNNGWSKDYPSRGDREWWLRECRRVVGNARKHLGHVDLCATLGVYRLTEPEWNLVFALGDGVTPARKERAIHEAVAAGMLRKAKWSVLRRRTSPDDDGTYRADIKADWIADLPACKAGVRRREILSTLERLGLCSRACAPDRARRVATVYAGFRLNFTSPYPRLPFGVQDMIEAATRAGVDIPVLEYCLIVDQRYTDPAKRERYGRAGARWITGVVGRALRGASEVDQVSDASSTAFHISRSRRASLSWPGMSRLSSAFAARKNGARR